MSIIEPIYCADLMSFCSLQSVVPFLILVACVKSNLIVTYIVSFAAGVSVAAAFLLPW